MNKMMKCVLLVALAPIFSIAQAQNTNSVNSSVNTGAYVTDSSGAIVKSDFGLCWRTSSWTPQTAIRECDPGLFRDEVVVQQVETIRAPEVSPIPVIADKAPINIIFETYFNFDRAQLKESSRDRLSVIARKIKELNIEVINLTGHADRIGSDEYNQSLSERRADIVKQYLVGLGVAENKIFTEAKGETQPKVNCDGVKSAKVITCLAPNRRVEIEVIGSKK